MGTPEYEAVQKAYNRYGKQLIHMFGFGFKRF